MCSCCIFRLISSHPKQQLVSQRNACSVNNIYYDTCIHHSDCVKEKGSRNDVLFLGDASNSHTLSCPWTFHDDEDHFHSLLDFTPYWRSDSFDLLLFGVCYRRKSTRVSIYSKPVDLPCKKEEKGPQQLFFGEGLKALTGFSPISDSRPLTTVQSVRKIRRLLLLYSPSASSLSFFLFFFFFFTCGDVRIEQHPDHDFYSFMCIHVPELCAHSRNRGGWEVKAFPGKTSIRNLFFFFFFSSFTRNLKYFIFSYPDVRHTLFFSSSFSPYKTCPYLLFLKKKNIILIFLITKKNV